VRRQLRAIGVVREGEMSATVLVRVLPEQVLAKLADLRLSVDDLRQVRNVLEPVASFDGRRLAVDLEGDLPRDLADRELRAVGLLDDVHGHRGRHRVDIGDVHRERRMVLGILLRVRKLERPPGEDGAHARRVLLAGTEDERAEPGNDQLEYHVPSLSPQGTAESPGRSSVFIDGRVHEFSENCFPRPRPADPGRPPSFPALSTPLGLHRLLIMALSVPYSSTGSGPFAVGLRDKQTRTGSAWGTLWVRRSSCLPPRSPCSPRSRVSSEPVTVSAPKKRKTSAPS